MGIAHNPRNQHGGPKPIGHRTQTEQGYINVKVGMDAESHTGRGWQTEQGEDPASRPTS